MYLSMAKMTNKRNKPQNKKKNRSQVARIPRSIRGALDEKAALYAALLADPCHGPLVSGPFGDSGGGFVSRFEGDYIVNWALNESGAAYAFVPGKAFGYVTNAAVTSDVSTFVLTANSTFSPGLTFLTANASSFRTLSCCLQVYWPGAELSRGGVTSVGQSNHATLIGNTQTTSALRSTSQYVERTPATCAEIVWRPNNYDMEWAQPGVVSSATDNKYSALFMSQAGIDGGAANGMRVRVVVVYEWLPIISSANTGLVQSSNRNQVSSNTFQDVIRHLDSFGDWMYHGALATGKAASSVYRGVRAMGQLYAGVSKVAPLLLG